MNFAPVLAVLALALTLAAPAAHATVILDNSTSGLYNNGLGTSLDTNGVNDPFPCANIGCGDATVSYPSAPNLSAASTAFGAWLTNPTAPGGTWSASAQAIPSTWAINSETAVIYTINAGAGLTGLNLLLGVDNGIFVWLDGNYLFGARAGGASVLGEYGVALPNLTGTHYLQVLLEDHGGGDGFDIQLNGTRAALVPEPATLALLGIGLFGLALRRRV